VARRDLAPEPPAPGVALAAALGGPSATGEAVRTLEGDAPVLAGVPTTGETARDGQA